ncbi:putative protein kinase STE-STE20-Fray family [Helianthus debilis subsp. tardiflorus]
MLLLLSVWISKASTVICQHRFLVSPWVARFFSIYLWVVMSFMAQGSCIHLMKSSYPDGFEESAIASILTETLKALEYLHRHGYIHHDVKVTRFNASNCGKLINHWPDGRRTSPLQPLLL